MGKVQAEPPMNSHGLLYFHRGSKIFYCIEDPKITLHNFKNLEPKEIIVNLYFCQCHNVDVYSLY